MSLDVYLMATKPCSVYSANITHNVNTMAMAVELPNDLTLYDVMWRPDEHEMVYAKDIVDYLHAGWKDLVSNPEKYKKFNPLNGWGSYDGLVNFVKNYHAACMENLDATLRVSR
jgi:hypothetical protein